VITAVLATFALFLECGKYEILWNIESHRYRYRNARDEGMKKILGEVSTERLTADCVRRKIKMNKTVYSQEVNKIMRSKKSGA
jgi:hypothetical protein